MRSLQERIEQIAADSIHGATYLTKEAVDIVAHARAEELPALLEHLEQAQPYMASLYNFVRFVRSNLHRFSPDLCNAWWEEFERREREIIGKAAALVQGRRILTHSYSSLVARTLLAGSPRAVLCTESRPHCEGVQLARRLHEAGIDVKLIVDAAAPYLIERVDMVLFGADGVGSFGLVHKIGSYPIALAAKRAGIAVVALAHPQKIWPPEFTLPPQPAKDPGEISRDLPALNYYFDITPHELLSKIIS